MNFQDSIFKFFCSTTGYTIESTTLFGIVLILFVYLIFKILGKLNVKIDRRLGIAISPFVLLGSSMRVLKDSGSFDGCLYQTPGIYFLFSE